MLLIAFLSISLKEMKENFTRSELKPSLDAVG